MTNMALETPNVINELYRLTAYQFQSDRHNTIKGKTVESQFKNEIKTHTAWVMREARL